MRSGAGFPWDAPAPNEHGKQWIEIELDHPVNPWEHEGAGSITWGANLDRLAPLGEEAVSIIKAAWERRQEGPRERAKREAEESEPVDRGPTSGAPIRPGWGERVELNQYWIHMTRRGGREVAPASPARKGQQRTHQERTSCHPTTNNTNQTRPPRPCRPWLALAGYTGTCSPAIAAAAHVLAGPSDDVDARGTAQRCRCRSHGGSTDGPRRRAHYR